MNTVTLENVRINVSSPEHMHLLTKPNLDIVKRGGALFGFYNPATKASFARSQYIHPVSYAGWSIKRLASLDSEAVEKKFERYPLGVAVSHLGKDPVIAELAPAPELAVALPKAPKETKKRSIKEPAKPKNLKKKPVTTVSMDTLSMPTTTIQEPIPFDTEEFIPSTEDKAFAMSA